MNMWQQFRVTVNDFWQEVFADQGLSDDEKQVRINFLLRLLPIIIPLLGVILISRTLFLQQLTGRTVLIFSSAFLTTSIIYLVARSHRYRLTINTLYLLGTSMIVMNAAFSLPPYYEITYLLILPFVAAMLLSLRETIFWLAFTFMAFIVFGIVLILPESAKIFSDLMQLALVFNVFILFAGYQRNRLERDRQKWAMEKNRGELLQFFLRSISHDFRTPLSIINSSTYLLERSVADEKQKAQLETINKQTWRIEDMMRDIITLSHLEYNFSERIEALNLQQIAGYAISTLQRTADDKHLTIKTDFMATPPFIMASYDGLVRIVTRLLDNAIQFSSENSVISIRVYEAGGINLEIADTGIGISEADLEHIFEPFFRADKSRSTYGSGLGLALVKKSVELFQGRITVTSTPDQGSIFRVTLPKSHSNKLRKKHTA